GARRRRARRRAGLEGLVLLVELPRVGHGLLGLEAVVVVHRADLAAVDAAGVVDDLEVEVDAEARRLLARVGQRAGERVRAAEHDLGVGHALLAGARPGRREQAQ